MRQVYFILFFVLGFTCTAQDLVYLRNGEVIEANVIRFSESALILNTDNGQSSYDTDAVRYVLYKNGILDKVSRSSNISRKAIKIKPYTSYELQLRALPKSLWLDAYNVFLAYETGSVRDGFAIDLTRWYKKAYGLRLNLFFGGEKFNGGISDIGSVGAQYVVSTNPFRRLSLEVGGGVSAIIYNETETTFTGGIVVGGSESEATSGTTFAINLDAAVTLSLIRNFQLKFAPKIYAAAYKNSEEGASVYAGLKIGAAYNIIPKKVGIQTF